MNEPVDAKKKINVCESDLMNFLTFFEYLDGQSDIEVEVELITKKFVEKGSSILLHCKHNIELKRLYKVSWHKNGLKVFEFINGRDPPFRNFTVTGSEIDVSSISQKMISMTEIDRIISDPSTVYAVQRSRFSAEVARL
jgi:hypothetical protein